MNDRVFESRRNRVWLERGCVCKHTPEAHAEAGILTKLLAAGVPVPRLISQGENLLVMEYVEGITLTEAIERETPNLAEPLTDWFASFYAAMPEGVCRGDVNCRNFILTPDRQLVGVDFEDLPAGCKETDLGRLTAFILTYDPPYSDYKKRLAQELIERFSKRFGLDPEHVRLEHERELEAMRRRRS